jgi:SagB-type dehydrogenase family enzyme
VRREPPTEKIINLPKPKREGSASLEKTLLTRRSVREFTTKPLTLPQLSQLLWAAQGLTHSEGLRTTPSAGALYPLEVYVAQAEGLFQYLPHSHQLQRFSEKDSRPAIARAALRQTFLAEAPVTFLICAVFARLAAHYGRDARRYTLLEVGHAAQNILLQATALGLGGVPIGAFYLDRIRDCLPLPADHEPLYLIPVGYPRP